LGKVFVNIIKDGSVLIYEGVFVKSRVFSTEGRLTSELRALLAVINMSKSRKRRRKKQPQANADGKNNRIKFSFPRKSTPFKYLLVKCYHTSFIVIE